MELSSDYAMLGNQDKLDQFKTKMEVDTLNKSLKKDNKAPVKELGKDEFLKLLITEMSHQDPTNPMQDREFIAQMAQFSSLEQMMNFNTGMSKLLSNNNFSSSFNLLGKDVEIEAADKVDANGNTKIISGKVEAIKRSGDESLVTVNGELYSTAAITKVK